MLHINLKDSILGLCKAGTGLGDIGCRLGIGFMGGRAWRAMDKMLGSVSEEHMTG